MTTTETREERNYVVIVHPDAKAAFEQSAKNGEIDDLPERYEIVTSTGMRRWDKTGRYITKDGRVISRVGVRFEHEGRSFRNNDTDIADAVEMKLISEEKKPHFKVSSAPKAPVAEAPQDPQGEVDRFFGTVRSRPNRVNWVPSSYFEMEPSLSPPPSYAAYSAEGIRAPSQPSASVLSVPIPDPQPVREVRADTATPPRAVSLGEWAVTDWGPSDSTSLGWVVNNYNLGPVVSARSNTGRSA